MERDVLLQLFDQILNGADIPTPKGMLRVRQENAAAKNPNLPYSMLTNLAHAVLWQNLWLDKLAGAPKKSSMEVWKRDWRKPEATEWDSLRADFVSGLEKAREVASSRDLAPSDIETLLRIAIHASYHMGQMNLLKRAKSNTDEI